MRIYIIGDASSMVFDMHKVTDKVEWSHKSSDTSMHLVLPLSLSLLSLIFEGALLVNKIYF